MKNVRKNLGTSTFLSTTGNETRTLPNPISWLGESSRPESLKLGLSEVCFREWRESFLTLARLVGQVVCGTAYGLSDRGNFEAQGKLGNGRERRHRTLGRLGRKKVGSLPPVSVFFPW